MFRYLLYKAALCLVEFNRSIVLETSSVKISTVRSFHNFSPYQRPHFVRLLDAFESNRVPEPVLFEHLLFYICSVFISFRFESVWAGRRVINFRNNRHGDNTLKICFTCAAGYVEKVDDFSGVMRVYMEPVVISFINHARWFTHHVNFLICHPQTPHLISWSFKLDIRLIFRKVVDFHSLYRYRVTKVWQMQNF